MSTFFGESTRESAKIAKTKLFSAWKTLDASDMCAIGFEFQNNIYLKVISHDDIAPFVGITREQSNGDNFRIRLTISKKQKAELTTVSAILCNLSEMESIMEKTGYNRGEAFEFLVKQHLGLDTKKDESAWFNNSDLTFNGVSYSVKFENGTICSELHFINNGFTTADFENI